MADPKSPDPISAFEKLRLRASQAVGVVGAFKKSPWRALDWPRQQEHLTWAAAQGEAQAVRGLEDPVAQSLFFNRMLERFESLPMMPRLAALGLTGPDADRDRLRLAMSYSGHPEFGECEELLAAIEARRIIEDRGFPKYWSQDQALDVKIGLRAFLDRVAAQTATADGQAKREAFAEAGKAIGALGTNCDLMALFCQEELARSRSLPKDIEAIDQRQKELQSCAKNLQGMPGLGATILNVAFAGAAGVAMAAVAPHLAQGAMPWLQELGQALPSAQGWIKGASDLSFGYGLAASCSALAASAGAFLGVGFKSASRLDAVGEAVAVKEGLAGLSVSALAAQAVDERLCAGLMRMSDSTLSPPQRERFIDELGYARSVFIGSLLHGPNADKPPRLQTRSASLPRGELALLGQIPHPSVAAAFLLEANSRSERLELLMLQKRLDYLGATERPLDDGDKNLAKARKLLVMGGTSDAWAATRDPLALREALRERLDQLSPLGKSFASMCPRSQQAEFVAKILERPFDAERPDWDMAQRLGETLKIKCARLERKNFFERKFSAFASKATKSLVEDPMRALEALREWVHSRKAKQSMDFDSALERLADSSGGIEATGWRGLVAARSNRVGLAQSRFQQALAGSSLGASSELPRAALSENSTEGLSRLASKMKASRESRYASSNPSPPLPAAPN